MKLVTAQQMALLDRQAIEGGISSLLLMERAGQWVVTKIYEHFRDIGARRVAVLAGRGNNGGDALVVARHLQTRGVFCRAFVIGDRQELSPDAKANLEALEKCGGQVTWVSDAPALESCLQELPAYNLVVDGLLGTGLKDEVRGSYRTLIEAVNGIGMPVVAIDIPSGLDASTGKVLGAAIKADLTVTFGLPKIGQAIHPGATLVGVLEVVDIGIPPALVESADIVTHLIDRAQVESYFRPRPQDSHKGDYGRILVIAGGPGFTGAATLCCFGALRVGTGLITLAIPRSLNPVMEVKLTEAMTAPVDEGPQGHFSARAAKQVEELWQRATTVVIGPGIAPTEETLEFMVDIISRCPVPLVIDAGGLDAVAALPGLLKKVSVPAVVTPHPGEMGRMITKESEEVQADRLGIPREFALSNNVAVILKGSRTVVALPSGRLFVNPTGNPGMASGGMGDVLTGMVGGFLAQGLSLEAACCSGVYLHGLAGDAAARRTGTMALAATDLLDALPRVLRGLERGVAGRSASYGSP